MKIVYRVKYRSISYNDSNNPLGGWLSTGEIKTKKDAENKAEFLRNCGHETRITEHEDTRYAN